MSSFFKIKNYIDMAFCLNIFIYIYIYLYFFILFCVDNEEKCI